MKEIEEYLRSDRKFAEELIGSLITNLVELRESLLACIKKNESTIFFEAYHKLKMTLRLTGDWKLQQQADQIHTLLKQSGIAAVDLRIQNVFCRLCTSSIGTLKKKLEDHKSV